MNRKACLYAVIGGIVGTVITLAVCSVMPLGAQNGDATFGEITCTGLKVVDTEEALAGLAEVEITPANIVIRLLGGMKTRINATAVEIDNVNISSLGVMMQFEDGRRLTMSPNGVWLKGEGTEASMLSDSILVRSDDERAATLGIGEHGGRVAVTDNGAGTRAIMAVNTHGGYVGVFGKGDSKTRAVMSVNEYGNGGVGTWDKNGYRLK